MQSLLRICGVILADRIHNEIHRIADTGEDVMVRMKKNVLSCSGHIERTSDERKAKNIYDGKVDGKRGTERPRPIFENIISKILEEGHVKSIRIMYENFDDSGRDV